MTNTRIVKFMIIIVIASITLFACDNTGTSSSFTPDHTRTEFTDLQIVLYDSKKELNDAHTAWVNDMKQQGHPAVHRTVEGFAQWYPSNPQYCKLHLVKSNTTRNDNNVTTWGHELKHCVYGLYHKQ